MANTEVPQPGPAKLIPNAGPDEWLEAAKNCKYLSEKHMKELCEVVKEFMMEGERRSPWCEPARSRSNDGLLQNPTSNPSRHQSLSAEISTASSTMSSSSFASPVECLTSPKSNRPEPPPPSSLRTISSLHRPSQIRN